ncbi:O-antigen ligase family protein [Marinobacter bohaiensis]|uniref:O-antigen ligase family protein n=1 Tax=Marinobacter bohaiensis TaxID=2201898 RepID=UPI000DAE1C69|nr:O-antigen ligase family protein [Marinobacter bohaiensis]
MKLTCCFRRAFLPLLILIWVAAFFGYLGWKPGFAYNAQRYFEILILGCILCVGVTLTIRFRWGRIWGGGCVVLLLLMVLAVWQADNRWLAFREGALYLALFAGVLAVAKVRAHAGAASFDRAAYTGLVLFSFGCSLIVLEGLLLSLSINKLDPRIIFGAFVNVRVLAELQFLTLLLLPAAWLQADSIGWRRFVALTAVLWWALLLLTGTRAALIALPFSLLVLFLTAGRDALQWFRVLGAQFIGGLCVFLVMRVGVAHFLGQPLLGEGGMSFARASSSGRLELWWNAWVHFLERPWLGNGPGSFACFSNQLVATPHNLFFQFLSEWGLLVTLLAFALALFIFIKLVQHLRFRPECSVLHYSLFATLITVVTASMMEGMITGPLQQMLIVLVFGWALQIFGGERFFLQVASGSLGYRSIRLLLLVAFLALTLWGVKADLAMQRELLVSPDGKVNLSYGPRFWADGHDYCPGWHERYEKR